jgi:hypothetical protein|tara:strand:- start:362 stop:1033 length:672 start_codon:yes stop_codon:yes gene_type:complete
MKTANKDNGKTIVNPLSKAIEEFKKQIDPKKDYAQLGGKGKYLTVPYRLKFIREYFGDRIRIITISFDLPNNLHKFQTDIWFDNKVVATGLSKQTLNKDKEFEKQSTVSVGRALSMLGFMGDEIATAEEMIQFLNPVQTKPHTNNSGTLRNKADKIIALYEKQAQYSASPHNFEKGLQNLLQEYADDIGEINQDPVESVRISEAYERQKQLISKKQQERKANG